MNRRERDGERQEKNKTRRNNGGKEKRNKRRVKN
jgi:hypothetical protein